MTMTSFIPGDSAVPPIPMPDDPVLAIILERLDVLKDNLFEHRRESKEEREKTAAKLAALEHQITKKIEPMTAALNKAGGGYIVLIGLAGVIAWVFTAWDHIVDAIKVAH